MTSVEPFFSAHRFSVPLGELEAELITISDEVTGVAIASCEHGGSPCTTHHDESLWRMQHRLSCVRRTRLDPSARSVE